MYAGKATVHGHDSGFTEVTKGERQPNKFNDVFWAFLFLAHLGAMGYCGMTYIPQLESELRNAKDAYGYDYQYINAADYGYDDANRMLTGDQELSNVQNTLTSRLMRVLGVAYLTISDYWNEEKYDGRSLEEESSYYENLDPNSILLLVTVTIVLGFVFATFSMTFMIRFAEFLIKLSVIANILLGAGMAVVGVIYSLLEIIALGAATFVLASCYAYFVWNRIAFAATNLVTASIAVKNNMGVTFFAWAAILVGGVWMVFWSITTYATVYIIGGCDIAAGTCENGVDAYIIFLLVLSLYWTQQVISNVVHVTVAGTVGTWWWAPLEADSCCSEAVRSSHARAMTNSFGSICLGSLIVAIIQTIKTMLEKARETDDGVLLCIADCCLGCLETIIEMFNEWAFVYVGLYGYTFVEAASNVMTLFRVRGWTAIITDYMVDRVIVLVSFGNGVVVGGFAALISYSLGLDIEEVAFFIGLVVGFFLTAVLLGVVGSAVNTIIVCYAEDPATFHENHYELSERMRESWRQAFPHDFNY